MAGESACFHEIGFRGISDISRDPYFRLPCTLKPAAEPFSKTTILAHRQNELIGLFRRRMHDVSAGQHGIQCEMAPLICACESLRQNKASSVADSVTSIG